MNDEVDMEAWEMVPSTPFPPVVVLFYGWLFPFVLFWSVCKDRNERIFKGEMNIGEYVLPRVVSRIAKWERSSKYKTGWCFEI